MIYYYIEPKNQYTNDLIIQILHDGGNMEESINPSIIDRHKKSHSVFKISEDILKKIRTYKKNSDSCPNIGFSIFNMSKNRIT